MYTMEGQVPFVLVTHAVVAYGRCLCPVSPIGLSPGTGERAPMMWHGKVAKGLDGTVCELHGQGQIPTKTEENRLEVV